MSGAGGREAGHVILYEDMARRRVKALVAAIRDLQVRRSGGHWDVAICRGLGKGFLGRLFGRMVA